MQKGRRLRRKQRNALKKVEDNKPKRLRRPRKPGKALPANFLIAATKVHVPAPLPPPLPRPPTPDVVEHADVAVRPFLDEEDGFDPLWLPTTEKRVHAPFASMKKTALYLKWNTVLPELAAAVRAFHVRGPSDPVPPVRACGCTQRNDLVVFVTFDGKSCTQSKRIT